MAGDDIDRLLNDAANSGCVPGVVALAAGRDGTFYQGAFGSRSLADVAPSTLISTEAERGNELRLDAAELRAEADLACGRAAQLVPMPDLRSGSDQLWLRNPTAPSVQT